MSTRLGTDTDSLFRLFNRLAEARVLRGKEYLRERVRERYFAHVYGAARDKPSEPVSLHLRLEDVSAFSVADMLRIFDHAARYGADAIVEWTYGDLPFRTLQKFPRGGSNLDVRRADQGSLDFLLTATGALRDILLADPVQLVITVDWFWQHLIQHGPEMERIYKDDEAYEARARELADVARTAVGRGHIVTLEWRVASDGAASGKLVTAPPAPPKR